MRRPRPPRGCQAIKKNCFLTPLVITWLVSHLLTVGGKKHSVNICTTARFKMWPSSTSDATYLQFNTINLYLTRCLSFPWGFRTKMVYAFVLHVVQSLERKDTGCNTRVWLSAKVRSFFFGTSLQADMVSTHQVSTGDRSVRSVQIVTHINLLPTLRMRGSLVPLNQGQHYCLCNCNILTSDFWQLCWETKWLKQLRNPQTQN